MARSSFDRIRNHLRHRSASQPVGEELEEDLEVLVRRCDEVRSLGQGFGSVELSPYMKSLLRVSKLEEPARLDAALAAESTAAAGS